jgi:hypothetical protein
MNKLNDIFKMISQMEKNAEEVKLGKHEVQLSLVDDIQKEYNKYAKSQLAGNSQTDAVSHSSKKSY